MLALSVPFLVLAQRWKKRHPPDSRGEGT
jgi:hypothetical protein